MKILPALLVLCLLLCGCERPAGLTNLENLTVPSESASAEAALTLYAPGSTIERQTAGAVKAYPLPFPDAYSIKSLGDDLLVFSGSAQTTLTVLSGSGLTVSASVTLDTHLDAEDPSLYFGSEEFSFYNEATQETVVLNHRLKQIFQISAPEGIQGKPILSGDRSTLYYCTETALVAWDLREELHRTLKQLSYDRQTLQGLYMQDTVVQCNILDGSREETLFLSTQAGKLLHAHRGSFLLTTKDTRYYGCYPTGIAQALVFGQENSGVTALTPEDITAKCTFLPSSHSAVTISTPAGGSTYLSFYDLASGCQTASLTLPESQHPLAVTGSSDRMVSLLTVDPEFGCETVYRWDCSAVSAMSQTTYTGNHYTPDAPDLQGLEACQSYADALSEKYGISIKIWKDAAAVQPWDYTFEPEYLTGVLEQELKVLDQRLSVYPGQLLADTASHFSSLSICLVRQLTGTQESTSLDQPTGIQFVDGLDAYVVLAVGEFSDRTLYHELFHVMETHMWGNCSAFDRWEELNPSGFKYDYSYLTNKSRDAGVYLQSSNRAFVDIYSMSFPKEDRARIMEYAMLPGNEEVFQSPIMQRKLSTLCKGIRDAYRLKDWEGDLLWEQYLE